MKRGVSYEEMIESRWWEKRAYHRLMSTDNTLTIGQICSFIPTTNEHLFVDRLKTYSNLDALAEFSDARRAITRGKNTKVSIFLLSAEDIWRALRFPARRALWDSDWQLPNSTNPCNIAHEILAVVYRAVFRVPLLDFVKCALEYDALFVDSLLNGVYDIHDKLQLAVEDKKTRETYIEVEEILHSRLEKIPLAHRNIAGSLSKGPYLQETTLALMLKPIKDMFVKHNLDVVLERLAVLDRRFTLINQNHEWDQWSVDLDFVEYVYQVLWMVNPNVSSLPAYLPSEDGDEKVQFLRSLVLASEDQGCGTSSRSSPFIRKLRKMYNTLTSRISCIGRQRE